MATVFIFATSTNPFDGQNHSYQDVLGFGISLAYPILDGVMLVPAATILWGLRRADPAFTHWILICTFIAMLTVGDIGFGYSELIINEDIAKKQLWIWDTFYNASYISIAAALLWYNKFWRTSPGRGTVSWHRDGLLPELLPFVAILAQFSAGSYSTE
jgi:hypothetical protein